jgi:ribosomal protein L25 (general stress protein Ctc)
MDLSPDQYQKQRQAMQEMIEAAARDQKKQHEWIGNLYRSRLQELQETEIKRQEWLKIQQKEEEATDELA